MAKTSASDIIAVPKAGGALKGLGETFSPDLHTGTGNFTIPIAIPPGRNGFQPQLNLAYSTGNGNGPFDLGWALSVRRTVAYKHKRGYEIGTLRESRRSTLKRHSACRQTADGTVGYILNALDELHRSLARDTDEQRKLVSLI